MLPIETIFNKLFDKKQSSKYLIIACTYDKRGSIIEIRYNNYKKTHPIQSYFAKKVGRPEAIYLHAEIYAILASKTKDIYGIAVARIDRNGNCVLAKPCTICQEVIKAYGIQEIMYTIKTDDGNFGYEFYRRDLND